jgi:redox-sensitive bicupin YhaK (pirin superfamily)
MSEVTRRDALKLLASAGAAVGAGCADPAAEPASHASHASGAAAAPEVDPVLATLPLGFPWQTRDPFLFCVHHDDRYPRGNEQYGPAVPLDGRNLGQDFEGKDGWRMYHGLVVPGFPRHPHRGFETVTVVRRGLLDHSDSMGAAARYGQGDVQWLTAGDGIMHAEMFPLLKQDEDNPVELFQIWLNLPARNKRATPHFSMLWNEAIPRHTFSDAAGKKTVVTVNAGRLGELMPPPPPPKSWASEPDSDVAIWTIALEAHAEYELPAARTGTDRSLYLFSGQGLQVGPRQFAPGHRIDVIGDRAVRLRNGAAPSELLLLQGRPIGEPVAKYGPFVMNTQAEIHQAYVDFQRTQFGGWPWGGDDPVHGGDTDRFARRADGKVERPV